jgi:predicted transglutaminase-like cysteine proteinase
MPLPIRLSLRRAACCGLVLAVLGTGARAATDGELRWNDLLRRVLMHQPAQRAELINVAINQFDHAESPGPVVWQSPQQLVQRGAGDCKDFALAKFWLLRHSGSPRERVRMAYGDVWLGQAWRRHLVVLLWTDGGSPLVLDNLLPGAHRLADRQDLQIRFSFDETGFYDHIGQRRIPDQPLKGWQGLWERIAQPAAQAGAERGRRTMLASAGP